MSHFFAGMLVALSMTLSVGPGLMLYFQASMSRGFTAGLAVLSGLWISDLGFIAISFLGISQLFSTARIQHIAALMCAAILVVFGLIQWIKRPASSIQQTPADTTRKKQRLVKGFLSGFLLNSSNPFALVFWMTLVGIAGVHFGMRTQSFYAFFTGLISCAMIFDTTKCFVFSKITVRINYGVLTWINRIAGSAIMVSAILIVCKSFIVR